MVPHHWKRLVSVRGYECVENYDCCTTDYDMSINIFTSVTCLQCFCSRLQRHSLVINNWHTVCLFINHKIETTVKKLLFRGLVWRLNLSVLDERLPLATANSVDITTSLSPKCTPLFHIKINQCIMYVMFFSHQQKAYCSVVHGTSCNKTSLWRFRYYADEG